MFDHGDLVINVDDQSRNAVAFAIQQAETIGLFRVENLPDLQSIFPLTLKPHFQGRSRVVLAKKGLITEAKQTKAKLGVGLQNTESHQFFFVKKGVQSRLLFFTFRKAVGENPTVAPFQMLGDVTGELKAWQIFRRLQ